jgi:hypothetical protein
VDRPFDQGLAGASDDRLHFDLNSHMVMTTKTSDELTPLEPRQSAVDATSAGGPRISCNDGTIPAHFAINLVKPDGSLSDPDLSAGLPRPTSPGSSL